MFGFNASTDSDHDLKHQKLYSASQEEIKFLIKRKIDAFAAGLEIMRAWYAQLDEEDLKEALQMSITKEEYKINCEQFAYDHVQLGLHDLTYAQIVELWSISWIKPLTIDQVRERLRATVQREKAERLQQED